MDRRLIANPLARPLYVMAKPAGSLCNLACTYCYYLEKKELCRDVASPQSQQMSDEVLERYVREYIGSQSTEEVVFTWHGGEALLRPLSFYQKAVRLQRKYAGGHRIINTLQTNGTLLNDEWCRFFKANHFLIGISLDGARTYHDALRRTPSDKPSFDRVMRGVRLLQRHGVDFNILAVVNALNADDPEGFYSFFKSIGCHYIQFAPIVERYHADGRLATVGEPDEESQLSSFSVTPEQWGDFLCGLFDVWVRDGVGEYFIQIFDATLANWMGVQPGVCTMAKYCGHAGVMEYNGDVYSCDHFVFPQYKLGNIRSSTLIEMMYSPRQQRFGRNKYDALPRQCRECPYLFACWGECPKNRFIKDEYGEPGLNYLCRGFYKFFDHVAPYMDYMRSQLEQEQPPAAIMDLLRRDPHHFDDK
ncbi:anaerobic sulfatase-maturation protein [uncultured Porphyromonas sp.]|uniref:anaerobic sulfatase-maturation protein n=1 Tax=uncultured Porphyromonas sp. TaxID=159274 RepID=UPI0025CC73E7|nr:anaerobic sulfatase-maturation protein [uncultured Porphyromonas sp.]